MATEVTLRIAGMDCSHCASRLGQALQRAEGVIKAEVDEAGTATVRYDEARLSEDDLGRTDPRRRVRRGVNPAS